MKFDYFRPTSLSDLFQGSKGKENVHFLAGGTDLMVKAKTGVLNPDWVFDLQSIEALKVLEETEDTITIGSLVTHDSICRSELIKKYAHVVAEGSGHVGAVQVRNMGTIGGNICNASPAADSVPPLMVLDAQLNIEGPNGSRTVALKDFFNLPGRPHLEPGEVVVSTVIKKIKADQGASFQKIGKRKAMAIAVINAAAFVEVKDNKVTDARISLGSVAAKTIRATAAEEFIIGKEATAENFEQAGQIAMEAIQPISDVRSTKEYRLDTSKVLVKRALETACARAKESN